MKAKPKNANAGPITMRRVEKMSGSNPAAVVLGPSISKKPITIAAPAIVIIMKLVRVNAKFLRSSLMSSCLGFDVVYVLFCFIYVSLELK